VISKAKALFQVGEELFSFSTTHLSAITVIIFRRFHTTGSIQSWLSSEENSDSVQTTATTEQVP